MKVFCTILTLLVFVTCTHMRDGRNTSPTNLTEEQFWSDQKLRTDVFAELNAEMKLTLKSPSRNLFGKGSVISKYGRATRYELRDPLGRVQLLMNASGNEFSAFYPIERKVFLDHASGSKYLENSLKLKLTLNDLHALLVGILPFKEKKFTTWVWDAERTMFRGEISDPNLALLAYIDPYDANLVNLRVEWGGEVVMVKYGLHSRCCTNLNRSAAQTVALARQISLFMPKSQTNLRMDWKEVATDVRDLAEDRFRFTLPKDIQPVTY